MKVIAQNPQARHDYTLLDTFEAGVVLNGPEVKSVKAGHVSIKEAFVRMDRGEAWLTNAYVKPYEQAGAPADESTRTRKLLLNRSELGKLTASTDEKGLTIVPLAIGLVRGYVKVEIALGRGKKIHDKRAALKESEQKREADRAIKESRR